MKPSIYHSNRQSYNWLVYNIGDKFLKIYSKFYKYKDILVDLEFGKHHIKRNFLNMQIDTLM